MTSPSPSPESTESAQAAPKIIDAVGWVYVRERRLLCARSQDKDAFYLPGGKREPGESDWEAIAREVQEEIGLTLDPASFKHFSTIRSAAHGHGPDAQVILICYESGFSGRIQAAAEIAEIAWLGYGDRHRCAPATGLVLGQLHQQARID
jgi:8-oxo-dGTP diphosphatase